MPFPKLTRSQQLRHYTQLYQGRFSLSSLVRGREAPLSLSPRPYLRFPYSCPPSLQPSPKLESTPGPSLPVGDWHLSTDTGKFVLRYIYQTISFEADQPVGSQEMPIYSPIISTRFVKNPPSPRENVPYNIPAENPLYLPSPLFPTHTFLLIENILKLVHGRI